MEKDENECPNYFCRRKGTMKEFIEKFSGRLVKQCSICGCYITLDDNKVHEPKFYVC